MSGSVFQIRDDGKLVEMFETGVRSPRPACNSCWQIIQISLEEGKTSQHFHDDGFC